jgi:hypothetical protein
MPAKYQHSQKPTMTKPGGGNGFVLLVMVLIVTTVILSVALAIKQRSIIAADTALKQNISLKVYAMAQSCLDEGILRLGRQPASYTGSSMRLNTERCVIDVSGSPDKIITATATSTAGIFTRTLRMTGTSSPGKFTLKRWEELPAEPNPNP